MTEKELLDKVETLIRERLIKEHRLGYIQGIRHAAEFAGTYDQQITGTEFKFEDLILLKFNLIGRRKPRRKVMRLRTLREKKELQSRGSDLELIGDAIMGTTKVKQDSYLTGIMKRSKQ